MPVLAPVTRATRSPSSRFIAPPSVLFVDRVSEIDSGTVAKHARPDILRWEHHRGGRVGHRLLAALVLGPDLEIDERETVLLVLLHDPPFAPRRVAHRVEAAKLGVDALQETGIAHPVGDESRHPR